VISRLTGRLAEKHPTLLVVETGGVGFAVHVPLSTSGKVGEPGSTVSLQVHTHVREDAILLYGFSTVRERSLFELLISVSGIGPKVALGILSGIASEALERAVASKDVAALQLVPGVGKKTAERIIVELSEKIQALGPAVAAVGAVQAAVPADAVSALVSLGYTRAAATAAVKDALAAGPDLGVEEIVRRALSRVMKG
jgi:Holliday junction DNA helicase RuvA